MLFTNILFLLFALLMTTMIPPLLNQELFQGLLYTFGAWMSLICLMPLEKRVLRKVPKDKIRMLFTVQALIGMAVAISVGSTTFYLPAILSVSILILFYLTIVAYGYYLTESWNAAKQIFFFLLPFVLPFIIVSGLFDLPWLHDSSELVLLGVAAAFLFVIMVFLPYFIQMIWKCTPLPSELNARLETTCNKLHFKHAGLKIWTIMRDSYTAAIIGVIPRYKYIMFTDKLVKNFPPELTEAIMVHEIGHSKLHHLLFYPFITLGMILGPVYFIDKVFSPYQPIIGDTLFYFVQFLLLTILIGLAFRFFFGFFSRLFERQADLYILKTDLDPQQLILALDEIAQYNGNIHDKPNWHHYSIRERMHFLSKASQNSHLVVAHDRKVNLCLVTYFIILITAFLAAYKEYL